MNLPVMISMMQPRPWSVRALVLACALQVALPADAQTETPDDAPAVVESVVVEVGDDNAAAGDTALTPAQELALEAEAAARDEAAKSAAASAPRPATVQTRFTLRRISVPRSQYLDPDAVDAVIRQLIGRQVDLRDLESLTAPFNAMYRARGITLANVVIREIDLQRGLVELGFYEPRIGQVQARDGVLAPGAVYARRLALRPGELADTRRIEARQTRLELLTGVTTEIAVQQGAGADLLDLFVTPAEPPALSFSAAIDNHGSPSFGREQLTVSVSHASLLGQLDPFSASVTLSEGLRSAAVGYALPISADGFSVFAAGSLEKSRTVTGPAQTGTAWSAELGASYPVIVERTRQLTLRASLQRFGDERRSLGVLTTDQGGTAFLLGASYSRLFERGGLSYDQTLQHVRWTDGTLGAGRTTLLGGEGSASAQISDDWQVFGRLGWQYALGDNSPARFRNTLSSPTRVRGYPSGNSAGDSFVFGSLQVQRSTPFVLNDDDVWRVTAQPFAFVDAGRAYDRAAGTTTAQDPLFSAGVGSVFQIGANTVAEVSLAKPLRDANLFLAANAWRADFRLGVRF